MTASESPQESVVDAIVAVHQHTPGPLLPVLHAVQDQIGYIPASLVPRIAQGLNLSRADVHGVISFYHYFRTTPPGQHVLHLCRAEACQALHGEATEAHARKRLGIDFHHTTADGKVSLDAVYCLGLCASGPAAMLDGKLHARVTPARLDELLAKVGALA